MYSKKEECMNEYIPLLLLIGVSFLLSMLILGLSFVFSTQKADPEKVSAYECGFDPFDDARARFDIRFYLVAILFIIFDLEVTFPFPLAISLNKVELFGFWSMVIFLCILTIGFVYEWRKGALDWE
jgi:NADH:ubiquinone oxidoreductase subunit 3 (subunit A)